MEFFSYSCDVCQKQVRLSKYDIYCGICGKRLCKNCAKRGICAECYFELPEKYVKPIKKRILINKIEFWIAMTPIIAFLLYFILPIVSIFVHFGVIGILIFDICKYYGFFGIFPAICYLLSTRTKFYSNILKKVRKLPIPTFERFYEEFQSFFEDNIESFTSKYSVSEKRKKMQEFFQNNLYIEELIEQFVTKASKKFPELKDRITNACQTYIKKKQDIYRA